MSRLIEYRDILDGFERYGDTDAMEAMLDAYPNLLEFAEEVEAAYWDDGDYASESDRISEALRLLERPS